MGHDTRKRGTTSSGAKFPAILAFLKRKKGAKDILFLRFFYVRHEANNSFFAFYFIFFADNNTLCQDSNIFANLQDLHGMYVVVPSALAMCVAVALVHVGCALVALVHAVCVWQCLIGNRFGGAHLVLGRMLGSTRHTWHNQKLEGEGGDTNQNFLLPVLDKSRNAEKLGA